MIYIFETKLSESDSLAYAIKNIYGIGKYQSTRLCKKLGYSLNLKVKNLSEEQVLKLLNLIEFSDFKVIGDLKKLKNLILKRLVYIKSLKGLRKIRGLPVRGQRTHTNAKIAKKSKKY